MNSDFLVSIVMITLNAEKYLRESIKSIFGQTYKNIELIVIDGKSNDHTIPIVQEYESEYPGRIRYISELDKGAGDAWNKGWKMAKGDIIGWIGADDIYMPDTVEAVVRFFNENPDAYFVYGECEYIDADGNVTGKAKTRDFSLKYALNNDNPIPTMSAFYKREVIEKTGWMDTTINACDYDYWIRVAKKFPMHHIKKVLSRFRIHEGSVGGKLKTFKIYARERYIINRRHGGSLFSYHVLGYILTHYLPTSIVNTLIRSLWEFKKGRLFKRKSS